MCTECVFLTRQDFRITIGGDIHNWDPDGYIPAKEIKRVDRFTQFALVAGIDAVRDSGLDFSQIDPSRCGVILGSGIGGLGEIEAQMHASLEEGTGSSFGVHRPENDAQCRRWHAGD